LLQQGKDRAFILTRLHQPTIFCCCCRNPTPEWSTASEFPFWTPAKKFPLDHMVIGNRNGESEGLLGMERGLFEERYEFWKQLRKENPNWSMDKLTEFSELKDEL
jgi:hypothetical protein